MGKKASQKIKMLPSLNEAAFARKGDFANNWFDVQEEWENRGVRYSIHNKTDNLIECPTCKEEIDEGTVVLINPKKKERLEIPYSVLHYMDEHPKDYSKEPVYKGKFPRKYIKKILK